MSIAYKAIFIKVDTKKRAEDNGAKSGKTFDYVINEAFDALDEKNGIDTKVKKNG